MLGIVHALETMRKIDAMIEADDGASFRGWLGRVLPHIGDAYRDSPEDGFRTHLGASILGEECGRKVWYNFRWHTRPKFPARILRLFNRGHLEEGRIIALLLMIGCNVLQQDANGKQFRISYAHGHAGGSGDGVAAGIPDLKDLSQFALLEFKTHNTKSFTELAGKGPEWRKYVEGKGQFTGKGVRICKPEHYTQMQQYMRKMGLAVGLYVASCKETDDLYMELVYLNSEYADQVLDRGDQIVWTQSPPKRLSESPSFFKCKWCDDQPVCQLGKTPAINCRTCPHSEPLREGEEANGPGAWRCNLHNIPLSKEKQLVGCPDWDYIR